MIILTGGKEMKVVISAVILAVAILLGSYFNAEATRFNAEATRYEIIASATNFYPQLIDRRTGRVWLILGNDFDEGWQLIPTVEK